VSFNDSDWTSEAEASPPPERPSLTVAQAGAIGLAGGVAIGALATALVFFALQQPPSSVTAATSAASAPAPARPAAPQTAAPKVEAVPQPATTTSVVNAVAPEASPRIADPIATAEPPAAGPPKLPPAEVAARKERAWARYYKRPPFCEGNPTADQLIECGNHFIRSKREFEERWRTGTL
jgi:hypothetical protein